MRCLIVRLLVLAVALACLPSLAAQDKKPDAAKKKKGGETYTSAEAAGPDFKVQGEYVGEISQAKWGAQVVARGEGKFDVYFLAGGLPGAGWDTKMRTKAQAVTKDGRIAVEGAGWRAELADGWLTGKTPADEPFSLRRVERQSPTLGARPPDGAVVLFDGTSADAWNDGKLTEEKLLGVGTRSKQSFAAGKYHFEFRTPFQPQAGGQGRGNSGVYILGKEIQVLDSFGLTGEKNECGAFYGYQKPAVNMCLPPLTWQTYDVEIKPDDKGALLATVRHNGVKVHEDFKIADAGARPQPINLQNHGNPVAYCNIWVVPASP